jgi:hypothetical protein
MRTTVTLDPDVEALIKRAMRERGLTFKQALNDAVRAGAASRSPRRRTPAPTYDLGEPLVDVTKALRLAGELEDQERAARLARGV